MISHQYKCIFIHIPKTAGTSIEQKLGHFKEPRRGVQDHRTITEIEPISLMDLTRTLYRLDLSPFIRGLKKKIKHKLDDFELGAVLPLTLDFEISGQQALDVEIRMPDM